VEEPLQRRVQAYELDRLYPVASVRMDQNKISKRFFHEDPSHPGLLVFASCVVVFVVKNRAAEIHSGDWTSASR